MGIMQLMLGFAGSMGPGDIARMEEMMDMSGRKLGERLAKEGKLHYDMLDVHQRIDFKALISLDKSYTSTLSHRMDKMEFELLQMMQLCTKSWRATINIMLDKWQTKFENELKNTENETGDNGNGVQKPETADKGVAQ